MSEKKFLIIVIPPKRNAEEQSLPRLASERGLARPAESKMPGKAKTLAEERMTRIGCESMKNTQPKRRL